MPDFAALRADNVQREAVRLAEIDRLQAAVWDEDAEPLVPGEQFHRGAMFEGFYAGMILGRTSQYVAVWSKMARRVAILPTAGFSNIPEVGSIVAMHAWGSRAVMRRCVVLTKSYDWLDAFDDFIVALQRSDRDWRMSIAIPNVGSDIFALDARGQVSFWYRDFHAFYMRELAIERSSAEMLARRG